MRDIYSNATFPDTPVPGCTICNIDDSNILLELPFAQVILPPSPHLSPEDGGHLYVCPIRHVSERRFLTPTELLAVDWGTLLAANALEQVFFTDWQNYQENGNWALDGQVSPHMHVHVYGRLRGSENQPFGEALMLPRKRDLELFHVRLPTPKEQRSLKAALNSNRQTAFGAFREIFEGDARHP